MSKLFVANVSSVVVGVSIIVWIPMAVGLWGVVSMAVKPNMFECPMPIRGLNRIPDTVSDEQALFVGDILATGFWSVRISEITWRIRF